jgi:hypothetical protein
MKSKNSKRENFMTNALVFMEWAHLQLHAPASGPGACGKKNAIVRWWQQSSYK